MYICLKPISKSLSGIYGDINLSPLSMYWGWRLEWPPVFLFFYMCGLNSAMTAFIRMPTEPTGLSPT